MADQQRQRVIRDAHRLNFEAALATLASQLREPDSEEKRVGLLAGLHDLQEKFNTVDRMSEEVEELLGADDAALIAQEIQARGRDVTRFHQARVAAEEKLNSMDQGRQEREFTESPLGDGRSAAPGSDLSAALMSLRLPAVDLPIFKGDVHGWQEWWSLFDAAHTTISPVYKFAQIKSKLEGVAKSAIASIPLTAENYPLAIEKLRDRFHSNQVIINDHFRAFNRLAAVKNGDTSGFRQLFDEVENRVMGLQVLGISSSSYSNMITPLLLEKIPPCIAVRWYKKEKREHGNSQAVSNDTIKDLLEFLRLEVESEERCQLVRQGLPGQGNKRPSDPDWSNKDAKTFKAIPSASAFTTNAVTQRGRPEVRLCIYCREQHPETRCKTPVSKKMDNLSREKRCFICLKQGHQARSCGNPRPECRECGKRHHTSICRKREQK